PGRSRFQGVVRIWSGSAGQTEQRRAGSGSAASSGASGGASTTAPSAEVAICEVLATGAIRRRSPGVLLFASPKVVIVPGLMAILVPTHAQLRKLSSSECAGLQEGHRFQVRNRPKVLSVEGKPT